MDLLHEKLAEAASDPSTRPMFYELLMISEVFVITDGRELPIKDGVVQAPSNIGLRTWRKKDDTPIVPFFSSLEELRKSIQEKVPFLALNCKDFFSLISGGYVVLNPYSEFAKEFVPEEIEAILNGTIFTAGTTIENKKESEVLIGEPAVYPQKLVDIVTSYFKKDARVSKAYLVQFFNPDENSPPHPLLVIECKEEVFPDISGKTGMVARSVLNEGEFVDIMRAGSSSLANSIASEYKPFYKRKLFGLF